ncbi:hypothetical protein CCACVL1_27034 [Corchorus capsularis]|uniref:Uncharacterized protein n=1 Tax=Corchorus capsularis TaxID=210143 RepID=A0A1R3GCH2_COCAP|nr:hypothetical protein CCACVL1_27034 [Corchorus capsularis]
MADSIQAKQIKESCNGSYRQTDS